MFKYKNLPVAFSFQIIWALIWTLMIYLYGYKGFVFIVVGALRPLVLQKEPISESDSLWQQYYLILLYTAVTTCCLIILFYVFNLFFLPSEFITTNKPNLLLSLIPIFFFVHGIVGLSYSYVNSKDK
jgi:hypothetical protein